MLNCINYVVRVRARKISKFVAYLCVDIVQLSNIQHWRNVGSQLQRSDVIIC